MNVFRSIQRCGAGLALVVFASVGVAGEPVTFHLNNGTDFVMMEFYASPPSEDDWEEDILGADVLEPGETVEITINDGRDDCLYDFLAVFSDGEDSVELMHEEVEVCDGESYTYTQ